MKKLIAFLLGATMFFTMTACASNTSTTSKVAETTTTEKTAAGTTTAQTTAKPIPVTLNVAYMPNYASTWSLVTGISEGFFEEEGITINAYEFSDGPTEIAAMESGSIDLAYIGNGAHKLAAQKVCKIFLLSQISNAEGVIGLSTSGVNTLADLKGKKVGYSSGTSSETILTTALNSVGLTMDDIEAYDMEASNIVTAMVSGTLDACATWSPNTLQILKQVKGSIKLCDNMTFINSSVSLSSWVVMNDWATKNPDVLLRFTKALYKAMDFASQEANFPTVAKYVSEKLGIDYDTAFAQSNDAKWLSGKAAYESVLDSSAEGYYGTQQKAIVAKGDIPAAIPVADYVMFDVMKKAGEELYK